MRISSSPFYEGRIGQQESLALFATSSRSRENLLVAHCNTGDLCVSVPADCLYLRDKLGAGCSSRSEAASLGLSLLVG